jgi:hypothetical protein
MSTRGIIARTTGPEGAFKGVYNHSDSYPTYMGPKLFELLRTRYAGDLKAMLADLIDGHSAGWSQIGTECYCHPKRKRTPQTEPDWFTHESLQDDTDIEWVWVFDEENYRLYVRDQHHKADAGIVELCDPEPDWKVIECGADLERCNHYAWVHFPDMEGTNLSTRAYLGKAELEMRDAVAFIVEGKRYKNTGCGRHSSYSVLGHERVFPSDLWVATVAARNGKRRDIPVAHIGRDGYTPYPGVTWVLPGTKDNPQETTRTAWNDDAPAQRTETVV